MYVKSAQFRNIRSFADSVVIEFSSGINLLVGRNNAGKSLILRGISLLQPLPGQPDNSNFAPHFLRRGADNCELNLELAQPNLKQLNVPLLIPASADLALQVRFVNKPSTHHVVVIAMPEGKGQSCPSPLCYQQQPDNFLYPYFSRRKPGALNETINLAHSQTIEEGFQHLPSKVDALSASRYGPEI